MNGSPIVEKIKKLLALGAKNSGATEDERMTALRMAAALMARYGIDQSAVGATGENKPKARRGLTKDQEMRSYHISLVVAAGLLYGCKAIFVGQKNKKIRTGFFYVGRPLNIEAAEATALWLFRQTDELFKAQPRHMREDRDFRKSFKDALGARVLARVKELMRNPENLVEAGGTALVVQRYFDELRAENDEVTQDCPPMAHPPKFHRGHGTAHGLAAGDRVQLRKEVR